MKNTLAHLAKQKLEPYWFKDAHFLAEATLLEEAREIKHNIFLFEDGSLLVIDTLHATISVVEKD
jgi:hypothetical protein